MKMLFSTAFMLFSWLLLATTGHAQFRSESSILGRRLYDDPASGVFNKTLVSKHKETASVSPPRIARTTIAVPSTPKSPSLPSPTSQSSYVPPNRFPFTPPLPADYHSPFANKDTLRDSNSDNSNVPNRRPNPPPPVRVPSEMEMIPIRPMLPAQDTKKTSLNKPIMKKFQDLNYSEASSTSTSLSPRGTNETYEYVPVDNILPYFSVSRILSGGNGRKPMISDMLNPSQPKIEPETKVSWAIKQEAPKVTSLPASSPKPIETFENKAEAKFEIPLKNHPVISSPTTSSALSSYASQHNNVEEELDLPKEDEKKSEMVRTVVMPESPVAPRPEHQEPEISSLPDLPEPRTRYVLGVAWYVHVYLIAILFSILILCSVFNIIRFSAYKHLLSFGYFITLHGFLLLIGCLRSFYLFYDAYNINHTIPEPLSRLMLNTVFPLLTSTFAVLFLFLLQATDLHPTSSRIQRPSVLAIFILIHICLSVCIDLYSDASPYSEVLPLIFQCIFIMLCIMLGVTYIYLYKSLTHSSLRKQGTIFGSAFADPHRPTLAHAIRVTLATALLSLLMAVVQLYGMFGVYEVLGKDQPHPWLWWGFQFSVRVIEVSMCFLLAWAGIQPLRCEEEKETQSHNSSTGFALFSCGATTPRGSDTGVVDDIYPAICSTNQAIHNYSLRTGKQVYDDTFPLNNLPLAGNMFSHTTERRSLKKHPDHDLSKSICGTLVSYPERQIQPSPSMLVAENGFVRFRSLADGEQPPEDLYTPSSLICHRDDYGT
ncbi:unnamed protein product [Bemisia tabaci]|uniref:Proline-rich transmembrane protein 3/4 domain-containing protein n=1 Tax=Bemisia tabaci TaxID=7038 RepID=A0A9P0AFF9_BEMTA|nr:PREDICTED: uncharacterized protein LOC109042255 [Bemisia tabaci]CAH0390060.1 unnamed protein product [Bemisia tabaci]